MPTTDTRVALAEEEYVTIANLAQEATGRSVWPSTVKAVLGAAATLAAPPVSAAGEEEGEIMERLFRAEREGIATMFEDYVERVSGVFRRAVDNSTALMRTDPSAREDVGTVLRAAVEVEVEELNALEARILAALRGEDRES